MMACPPPAMGWRRPAKRRLAAACAAASSPGRATEAAQLDPEIDGEPLALQPAILELRRDDRIPAAGRRLSKAAGVAQQRRDGPR
jgi:hypothetical protein